MTKRNARSEFGILVEETFAFLVEDGRFVGPLRLLLPVVTGPTRTGG